MASINISNLHPAGSELFADSENYLRELSEAEISFYVKGGLELTTINPLEALYYIVKFASQALV